MLDMALQLAQSAMGDNSGMVATGAAGVVTTVGAFIWGKAKGYIKRQAEETKGTTWHDVAADTMENVEDRVTGGDDGEGK